MSFTLTSLALNLSNDFVSRTLSRLLPSSDVIERATPEALRLLAEECVELERQILEEPIRFFVPNPGAQWDFLTDSGERLRHKFFLAGNKSGKSTAAAILAAECATGQPLWGSGLRPPGFSLPFPVPNRGVYYADDFDAHKQTTLPTFLTWLPRRFLEKIEKNSGGYVTDIYLTNGSVINFKTYDQGFEKSEGKDWAWAVCDEPPSRDIYTGVRRGLVVHDGMMFIAATLLKESWLWDEMVQTSVRVYNASIFDNPWLPESARDEYVATLTTEEREIRVHGRPLTLSGVIYKNWRDDAPWVLPRAQRYYDPLHEGPWPVILGLDPHERKPLALIWFWLTPSNGLIAFDWALVPNASLTEVFRDIEQRENAHDQRSRICVIDPLRGRAVQMGGRSWSDEFEKRGWQIVFADNGVEMGHADVRDALLATETQKPWLRFEETLRGRGGPIEALLRYGWDDHPRGRRFERSVKEKPSEFYKDFPDIIRYVVRAVRTRQLRFDVLTDLTTRRHHVMQQPPRGRGFYA